MVPAAGEEPAVFNQRIRRGLAVSLDEERTTWWEAIRRDAKDQTPDPSGPEAARWRRVWEASRPPARPGRIPAWPERR